jgi:hypothetical protein
MTQSIPQTCELSHPGFRMLGEPMFRLSEGTRIPSMVVQLDNEETVLPLRSVAREFRIDPDADDGRMLDLIEQALDYVVALKLGDSLPTELRGGEASWQPNPQDRLIAASRVRHELLRCVFSLMGKVDTSTGGDLPGWEDEPRNHILLEQAIAGATAQIGGGVDEAEIDTRLASICEETAYIVSMHRTLIRGMSAMGKKLMQNHDRVPTMHQETVKQVQVLARLGTTEIMRRFKDVDARLEDVLAMLRDMAAVIAWLRRQRDWLFRTNHAWEPVFKDWASAPQHFDEFFMKVVERTYVFLAPRFMSFQDWSIKDARVAKAKSRAKVW